MNKINWNPFYFFSTTNENYVFGKKGIIWNKIASLAEKIIKPLKTAPPISKRTTLSKGDQALVDKMKRGSTFIYTDRKNNKGGSVFLTSMKTYYKDKDDVEKGFVQDANRLTLMAAAGEKLEGAPEEKLTAVERMLNHTMSKNTPEERLQVLNCLRQNLLNELSAQIRQEFIPKNPNSPIYSATIGAAFSPESKQPAPVDDASITLQLYGNSIKIVGKCYFQVKLLGPRMRNPENLAFVRASIHVTIPIDNFDATRCVVKIEEASTTLEGILPATDKAKKVAQEKLQ